MSIFWGRKLLSDERCLCNSLRWCDHPLFRAGSLRSWRSARIISAEASNGEKQSSCSAARRTLSDGLADADMTPGCDDRDSRDFLKRDHCPHYLVVMSVLARLGGASGYHLLKVVG